MPEYENSLASVTTDLGEAIKIIAGRMIETRKKDDVGYRPCRKSELWQDLPMLGERKIDLKVVYPDAKPGSVAYVGTVLESVADADIALTVTGNIKVMKDNEVLYDFEDGKTPDERVKIETSLKKGDNKIVFMVRCDKEGFGFSFMPSARKMSFMWAKDYLLHIRATSPIQAFRHEDGVGVSRLYAKETPFDGEYVYPPENMAEAGRIDFLKLFGNEKGCCAYAVTYAFEDCEMTLDMWSEGKVFVNGKEKTPKKMRLKNGDCILVKSIRNGRWGFGFDEKLPLHIPALQSSRNVGDQWLVVGSFGKGDCLNIPFGPELSIQYTAPYMTEDWKRTFWRMPTENDYVRVYMDTQFFGQWFYALMVGHFGLLSAAKAVASKELALYFSESMKTIAAYFEYVKYDSEIFGQTTFLHRSVQLDNLDAIGAIGMNLCEYYKLSPDPSALACVEELAQALENNIPRFEDGTFRRIHDMWADDIYMSCPFLIRLALIKGEKRFFEEAARQIFGFKKRLWMEDQRIFSHIFFLDTNEKSGVPWGRGNGWVLMSLSDVCEKMPCDMKEKEELVSLFREFAEGIAQLQDDDGLWHQVLTRRDSYKETSCTGMFAIAFIRGVKNGWLDEIYLERAKRAIDGLMKTKIDRTGNVFDVCMGSGNSRQAEYYMKLGAIDNDDHGTGIILTALAEMAELDKKI